MDAPPDDAADQYLDPTAKKKTVLLELRSTGGQTVIPPSIVPGNGTDKTEEPVIWSQDGEPARLSITELRAAAGRCAAAALLARHWPAKGARHDAALALAGGLIRLGWSDELAEQLLRAVCTAPVMRRSNLTALSRSATGPGSLPTAAGSSPWSSPRNVGSV